MRRAWIPELYRPASLDDFTAGLVRRLGDRNRTAGYTILGATGTGKTHLAVAILKDWVLTHRAAKIIGDDWIEGRPYPRYELSARFMAIPEWLLNLRTYVGGGAGDLREHLLEFVMFRGLIIDDLGAEKSSEWTGETIYNLVSQRVNRMMPTIVTTNLSLAEISERTDPRLASRLGGLTVLELSGEDRRLVK
jgi:DNA replication protein DnaC